MSTVIATVWNPPVCFLCGQPIIKQSATLEIEGEQKPFHQQPVVTDCVKKFKDMPPKVRSALIELRKEKLGK